MIEKIRYGFHTVDMSIWKAAAIPFAIPIIWYIWYCSIEIKVSIMPLYGINYTIGFMPKKSISSEAKK